MTSYITNLGALSPLQECGKSLRIPFKRTCPRAPGHAAHVNVSLMVSSRIVSKSVRRCLIALTAAASTIQALAFEELQNWFHDPFFQISAFVPDCPLPAGPFVSEGDRRVQAHRRAEKGTTCWLAKECDRPNAYAYDQEIASDFQAAAHGDNRFLNTTLWVTVQGRVVYIEGCAMSQSDTSQFEAFARQIPNVQQAITIVRTDPAVRPPYKLRFPE